MEVVHIDFNAVRPAGCVAIAEVQLPPGMSVGGLLEAVTLRARDRLQGPLHLGILGEHRLPLQGADVVEIDVHGQSHRRPKAEVQRRAALQYKHS